MEDYGEYLFVNSDHTVDKDSSHQHALGTKLYGHRPQHRYAKRRGPRKLVIDGWRGVPHSWHTPTSKALSRTPIEEQTQTRPRSLPLQLWCLRCSASSLT